MENKKVLRSALIGFCLLLVSLVLTGIAGVTDLINGGTGVINGVTINYGFANYECKTIVDDKTPLDFEVSVKGGKKASVSAISERSVKILNKKNEKRGFELDFIQAENVKAPVLINDIIGTLDIYENGVKIDSVCVKAAENIDAKSFIDILSDINSKWSIAS